MTGEDLPLVHASREPNGDPAGHPPAVVLLHGRGTNERDLLPIADELPEGLHVLSVRAPDELHGGFTWYDLDLSGDGLHESQPDEADFRRSLDLLYEFVDGAVDAYGLDPERIGLLGFSQGAVLSLAALIERPEAYAWVVALHGYLADSHGGPKTLEGAANKPVFVGYGRMDQVIPAERAERAAETLADAGLAVEVHGYPAGHGTTPQEVRDAAAWVERHV